MTGLIRAGPRLFAAGVLASTLALAGVERAEAQSVFFSGFTAGCFGTGCSPTTSSTTLFGLTYDPHSFSGTTSGGFLAIGGDPNMPSNNFGVFSLGFNSTQQSYFGQSFSILLTFINPSANTELFTAALTGSVGPGQTGGVTVFFNPFDVRGWSDAQGSYTVRLNPTSVFPGQSTTVTGDLTATAIPEPISMILLGTGLAGVGAVRRRRRSVTKADLI